MDKIGQHDAPTALPPGKWTPVSIRWKAGWASEPVWTFWRGEKFVIAAGNRTRIPWWVSP